MKDILKRIVVRSELALYVDGKKILDERGIRLLSILDSVGSLLEASKTLDIPYSRVWEYIAKLERALKTDVISVRRGGRGGSLALTPEGLEIVKYVKNVIREGFAALPKFYDIDIHIAGSDDMLLGSVVGIMRRDHGFNLLYSRIGSLRGLFSLLLGDSHIAPIHLIDPDSDVYNVPYIKRLGLDGMSYILFGYYREVGFVYRKNISINSIKDIIENNYRIVNRCKGSGIRLLFDKMLREYASSRGESLSNIINMVKGYGDEVETHGEAVSRIVEGYADVALGLRADASTTGLEFKPLRWESFDFVVSKQLLESDIWSRFNRLLLNLIQDLITSFEGYKLSEKFGELMEI